MQSAIESESGVVLHSGWSRFFYALRLLSRSRQPRPGNGDESTVDPIALTIMAVNRLGPATLRAVCYGTPVTVAAPNRQTAEIFRAALSEMEKVRPTDRLISVELTAEPAPVAFGTAHPWGPAQ